MTFVDPIPGRPFQLIVEMAFGYGPNVDSATWVWTDISKYVRGSVSIRKGKPSQTGTVDPAQVTLTLANTDGRFTFGNPMSPYWPNVQLNVPVRVRLTWPGAVTSYERITAFVDGWPMMPQAGVTDVVVQVQASDRLRAMRTNAAVLDSPLQRAIKRTGTPPLYYLPMEDVGFDGTLNSGLVGGTTTPVVVDDYLGIVSATPQWQGGSLGSASLLNSVVDVGNGSHVLLPAIKGVSSTAWTVDHVVSLGTNARGRNYDFWSAIYVGGTTYPRTEWDIEVKPRGLGTTDVVSLELFIVTSSTSSTATVMATIPHDMFDGQPHHLRLSTAQSGGSVNWSISVDGVTTSGTVAATTLQAVGFLEFNSLFFNPQGRFAVGHTCIWNTATPTLSASAAYQATIGYAGETAAARVARVLGEESVPVTVTTGAVTSQAMGPQGIGSLNDIVSDCEKADLGLLHGGGPLGALAFATGSSRYNAAAVATLDFKRHYISDGLAGTYDYQMLANSWQITRPGSQFPQTYTDTAASAIPGVVQLSDSANVLTDDQAYNLAAAKTALSSFNAMRFPGVGIDLRRTPDLASVVTALALPSRVSLFNLPLPYPPVNLDQFLEGYAEVIDAVTWRLGLVCSPYLPWQVGVLSDSTYGHLASAGTVLHAAGWNGTAGTFQVDTATGPLISTSAGDYPVDLNVCGQQVRVSGCSGASNPQTLTVSVASVNGVSKTHATGEAVALQTPFVLAL